jgi:hypothetical protein
LTVPIDFLRCYAFLCRLSDELENLRNAIDELDAPTAAQRCRDTPWCAPEPPLPPPPPSKRRKFDHGPPTAGPSGEGSDVPHDMDALDFEKFLGGSCGSSERDGDAEEEPEKVDEWMKRRETKEGCNAAVYDQLHGLPSQANWWQSYLE